MEQVIPCRYPSSPLPRRVTVVGRLSVFSTTHGVWLACLPMAPLIRSMATWRFTRESPTTPTGFSISLSLGRPRHGLDPARGEHHLGLVAFSLLPTASGFTTKSMAGSIRRALVTTSTICGFTTQVLKLGCGPPAKFILIYCSGIVQTAKTGCIFGAVIREGANVYITISPPMTLFPSKSDRVL